MERELSSRKIAAVRRLIPLRSHLVTMAGTTRAPARRLSFLVDLPEEILSEILLLLPPKYILRCRAVCRALRRIASDHTFLVAHHRRQPPRRLFTFVRDVGCCSNVEDLGLLDYCVESLDLRNHEFQSVARFTADNYDCLEDDNPLAIHAACDGLLLMSFNNLLYLCNPTTRQWVSISRPALQHDTIMGLYAHGSSEYRVLYCRHNHGNPLFFISTVNSEVERCIRPSLSSESMKKWLRRRSEADHLKEAFLFNGNLHWLPCLGQQNNILAFDTLMELFWWLRVPFKIRLVASLLEVEGTLAMSNSHVGSSKVDVWLLLDYRNAVWVRKYRIVLPVLDIRRFEGRDWCPHVVSQERDVLVDGLDWQLHYDINGKLLKKFQFNGHMPSITTHILRESLVSHAFFRTQENRNMREPPFFRGL